MCVAECVYRYVSCGCMMPSSPVACVRYGQDASARCVCVCGDLVGPLVHIPPIMQARTDLAYFCESALAYSLRRTRHRAAMNQELAAIRLYDVIGRGGQGVVFHGTLHGLETAVKVGEDAR